MCRKHARRGLTLVELLLAASIMTLVSGLTLALSQAVHMSWDHNQGHLLAAQHAHVVLERIARTVRAAHATADWPAVAVVYEEVNGWRFPDTLVVWTTESPGNVPRVRDCVIICPDPAAPGRLVEIRVPDDTRLVPVPDNVADLSNLIAEVKSAATDENKIELTDRLLVARLTPGSTPRAAVRFEEEMQPSRQQWADYDSGSVDREELAWPLGWGGDQFGLRSVWVRTELQLVTGNDRPNDAARWSLPFFGSATNVYTLGSQAVSP